AGHGREQAHVLRGIGVRSRTADNYGAKHLLGAIDKRSRQYGLHGLIIPPAQHAVIRAQGMLLWCRDTKCLASAHALPPWRQWRGGEKRSVGHRQAVALSQLVDQLARRQRLEHGERGCIYQAAYSIAQT